MPDHTRLPEPIHLATVGSFLRSMPSSTDDLVNLAKLRSPDASVFNTRNPAFWAATISTNKMDFYGTRMHDTTLTNFADSLNSVDGIAYQHSHDVREYIGRSLAGEMVSGGGDVDEFGIQVKQVNGVFFTIPDIKLGSMGTTDFIDAIRAGILRDVSVGFWADDIRCSICGSQLFYSMWWGWDGDCRHVPTMTYDVQDAEGNPVLDHNGVPQKQTCWGWVYNGSLGETSSVYDGATPGAAVYKAQLMAEAGLLDQRAISAIEQRFRTRLPDRVLSHRGFSMTMPSNAAGAATGTNDANGEVRTPPAAEARVIVELDGRQVDGDLAATGDVADELAEALVAVDESIERVKGAGFQVAAGRVAEVVRDFARVIETQRDKVVKLGSEAALGRQYKDDLIESALSLGVRAKGDGFKKEFWRGVLAGRTIEDIKVITDEWKADGDAYVAGGSTRLGGRSTVDGVELPEGEPKVERKKVPDHVHAG